MSQTTKKEKPWFQFTWEQEQKKVFFENLISLVLAFTLVCMVRSSVFEAFKIPSGSMIPTLFVGDHIFVNKFAYGLKIPFSDWATDHPIYLIERQPPKRGDVIVFMYPKDETMHFIKRVIGVAGDQIEIVDRQLYVNHQKVTADPVPQEEANQTFKSLDEPKYTESEINLSREHLFGADHAIFMNKESYGLDTFGPVTVPEGKLFVMGDNRDYSNDSRFWGFVPLRSVKGQAVVIWLSFIFNLKEGLFRFYGNRIGTALH